MTNTTSLYQTGPRAYIWHDVLIKEMWEILNPKFNHVFPKTFTIDSAFHRLPSQSLSGRQDVFLGCFFVSTGLSFSVLSWPSFLFHIYCIVELWTMTLTAGSDTCSCLSSHNGDTWQLRFCSFCLCMLTQVFERPEVISFHRAEEAKSERSQYRSSTYVTRQNQIISKYFILLHLGVIFLMQFRKFQNMLCLIMYIVYQIAHFLYIPIETGYLIKIKHMPFDERHQLCPGKSNWNLIGHQGHIQWNMIYWVLMNDACIMHLTRHDVLLS